MVEAAAGGYLALASSPAFSALLLSLAAFLIVWGIFTEYPLLYGLASALFILAFFSIQVQAGHATIFHGILFLIGAAFVVAEYFFIGAILGIIGSLLMAGTVLTAGGRPADMAVALFVALIAASIGMVVQMKVFGKKVNLLSRFVLSESTNTESGYVSNINRSDLIGRAARTMTALRPAGIITLDGERIDAVSDGSFIEAGRLVTVIKVEGPRIVVREDEGGHMQ